jgi:hypothetical protein
MNKKAIIGSLVVIISVLAIMYLNNNNNQPNQPQQTDDTTEYVNTQYGFALTLDQDFEKDVQIKDEGRTVYFVSRDIQGTQPERIFGVIGRIQIYSKAETTRELMMQGGEAYGLKYLGENEVYYFGWAHATDVQIPPGNESLGKEYRALETRFDEIIKTFKSKETSPPEVKTDSGSYVGLADNNFFEVEISGVQDKKVMSKVFMITDKTRAKFETLNLQTGEEVKIKYVPNEFGQNSVQDIERI